MQVEKQSNIRQAKGIVPKQSCLSFCDYEADGLFSETFSSSILESQGSWGGPKAKTGSLGRSMIFHALGSGAMKVEQR